jgi:hypothetical protein
MISTAPGPAGRDARPAVMGIAGTPPPGKTVALRPHRTSRSLRTARRELLGAGAPPASATAPASDPPHTRLLSGIAALSRSRDKRFRQEPSP